MDKIFEKLFYTFEETTPLKTPESEQAAKAEIELLKALSQQEKELFLSYQDMKSEVDSQYAVRDFKQGFYTGCRFLLELLSCEIN